MLDLIDEDVLGDVAAVGGRVGVLRESLLELAPRERVAAALEEAVREPGRGELVGAELERVLVSEGIRGAGLQVREANTRADGGLADELVGATANQVRLQLQPPLAGLDLLDQMPLLGGAVAAVVRGGRDSGRTAWAQLHLRRLPVERLVAE